MNGFYLLAVCEISYKYVGDKHAINAYIITGLI